MSVHHTECNTYADTNYISSLYHYNVITHHLGFGDFAAETPHGPVTFERRDQLGPTWEGLEGQPHMVLGEAEAIAWLLDKTGDQREVT